MSDPADVEDVGMKSSVQTNGSAGRVTCAFGLSGCIGLENGANVTPILSGSTGKWKIDLCARHRPPRRMGGNLNQGTAVSASTRGD